MKDDKEGGIMGFSIKRIDKYWKWIYKTKKSYDENKKTSKEFAKICLDLDIAMLLNKSETDIDTKAMRKHEWVNSYMEKICCETVEKYRTIKPVDLNEPQEDIKVWSMFWQGEEAADKLFQMCIDSARRHTKHSIVVLSKDNYQNYFTIPDYIIEKYNDGKIKIQHICDLMVMSILAEWGGFFTGATVWWSKDVTDDFLRSPFYTCRAATQRPFFASRSRWVGYVLAGRKDFPLFSFTKECLYEYWRKCDRAIDYLMMDYIFELAYRNIPCVKESIDNLPDNNLKRNELIHHLSDPYDENNFQKYVDGDTFLYKLSWKFGNKIVRTEDGRDTNYGYMLRECGDRIK